MLGFELEVNQGDQFIWLKKGAISVLLKPGETAPTGVDVQRRINFVLYSQSLMADVAALREHGVQCSLAGSCYEFSDLDDNWFQLVDPGDDHST